MKKFFAGGAVIVAGVTAALTGSFGPGEEAGNFNLCYVVAWEAPGGRPAGVVLEARSDLSLDFSSIEKGESSPGGTSLTVRTVPITEAQANSINAGCYCYKVDDLENPTGVVAIQ